MLLSLKKAGGIKAVIFSKEFTEAAVSGLCLYRTLKDAPGAGAKELSCRR